MTTRPPIHITAAQDAGFEVMHTENLRQHYALTLAAWCRNLVEHWDECVAEVGEGTARVWGLYMADSRLGFGRNEIQLHPVLGVATTADGAPVVEHPEVGEVVWCDRVGVTCRRWNWRQAARTRLRDDTTTALFILDALGPMTDEQLGAAADDLLAHLDRPGLRVARRLLARH